MKRFLFAGLILAFVSLNSIPSLAQKFRNPNATVVLFDGLTLDDLRNPAFPNLIALSKSGFVGLMNTAVAGPKNDTSAMLAMALGSLSPSSPTDEEAYVAGVETVERDDAGAVFERRTGYTPPASTSPGSSPVPGTIVHLGIAPLTRRSISRSLVGAIAAQNDHKFKIACFGNSDTDKPGRRVALFAISELGVAESSDVSRNVLIADADAPFGVRDNVGELVRLAKKSGCLSIVHLGDGARVEAARSQLTDGAYMAARHKALETLDAFVGLANDYLLLLSPRPPANSNGEWDRLTPVILALPTKDQNLTVLSSPTTRTPGLIANVDIAPTLLYWLGIDIPPTMNGHPIEMASCRDSRGLVTRIDRLVSTNAQATVPVFALLAVLAGLIVFSGLIVLARGGNAKPFAFGILFLMNMPLALMLAVPFSPPRTGQLAGIAAALMFGLAVIEALIGRGTITPPLVVAAFTCGAIVVDTLFGNPLIKFSLFSAYQLQGIRFYGVGNEYMGVLIGVGLLIAFLLNAKGPVWILLMFSALTLLMGLPQLGAKAGAFPTAITTFGVAFLILRGKRVSMASALILVLFGFALAFGIAALDLKMNGAGSTHIGGAIGGANTLGCGYLWEIVGRKVAMNFRILLNPFTLCALAGMAAIAVTARFRLRRALDSAAEAHSGWARGVPAAGWGALAAFLFNDSGIVAAIFLFGAFFVTGLYHLFGDAPNNIAREMGLRRSPGPEATTPAE